MRPFRRHQRASFLRDFAGGLSQPIFAKSAGEKPLEQMPRFEKPRPVRARLNLWALRLANRQEVLVLRPVFRRRLLKAAQCSRPQLYAIQIIVETIQRLDEITNNQIWRTFGQLHQASIRQKTCPAPPGLRGSIPLLFPSFFVCTDANLTKVSELFQPLRSLNCSAIANRRNGPQPSSCRSR